MHATLLDLLPLTDNSQHHAFTSLCRWRGDVFCAWRAAPSHHIIPPGHLIIQRRTPALAHPISSNLSLAEADCRDPRLLPTPEALYLLCGAYLPAPQHEHWHGLSKVSTDNILQTYWSYTVDGLTWAPLTPMMRVNTWGWSALHTPVPVYEQATQRKKWQDYWLVAAYQMGSSYDVSGSLQLFAGDTLATLSYAAPMYDGVLLQTGGTHPDAPHFLPCEPVLWQPAPDSVACCVRTETGMDMGVSRAPYQDWRWTNTFLPLHPSAILATKHGWLLAAREIRTPTPQTERVRGRSILAAPIVPTWHTVLYELPAGGGTPQLLLTLPSAGDTGYAALAAGQEPDTVLCSYYSQHLPEQPTVASRLPGAAVWLATLVIGA